MEKILWVKAINPMEIIRIKNDHEIVEDVRSVWDSLPTEIVIKIFNLLEVDDLLSISLVCKRFSEIVNNDKELMRNFTLCLNHSTVKSRWVGCRKYSRVKISLMKYNYGFRNVPNDDLHLNDFKKVLKSQCNNFTHLKIFLPKTDNFFSLKDLLVECQNLKFCAIFKEIQNPIGKKFFLNPLPKLDLDVLKLSCHFCSVIHMLMDCQVKRLYLNKKDIWKCCEISFKRFREKQKNLKIGILNEFESYEKEINIISSIRNYDEVGNVFYYRQ